MSLHLIQQHWIHGWMKGFSATNSEYCYQEMYSIEELNRTLAQFETSLTLWLHWLSKVFSSLNKSSHESFSCSTRPSVAVWSIVYLAKPSRYGWLGLEENWQTQCIMVNSFVHKAMMIGPSDGMGNNHKHSSAYLVKHEVWWWESRLMSDCKTRIPSHIDHAYSLLRFNWSMSSSKGWVCTPLKVHL